MSTPTRPRPPGPPLPAGTTQIATRPTRPGRRAMTDRRFAALMIAPAALFAWPLVRLVLDSFYNISAFAGGPRTFVGLANYGKAVTSATFLDASVRTVVYTVIVVTFEFVLGLGTALIFSALGRRSSV